MIWYFSYPELLNSKLHINLLTKYSYWLLGSTSSSVFNNNSHACNVAWIKPPHSLITLYLMWFCTHWVNLLPTKNFPLHIAHIDCKYDKTQLVYSYQDHQSKHCPDFSFKTRGSELVSFYLELALIPHYHHHIFFWHSFWCLKNSVLYS